MSRFKENIEVTLKNEYGIFNVIIEEINEEREDAQVRLLEDTPFAEKGDSSWVPLEKLR